MWLIENSQWLKYTKISGLGVQNRQNQIIKFINSKKIISFNRVRGGNNFYYGIAKKWGLAYNSHASSAASQTFLLRA